VKSTFVRVTALILGTLFLVAAATAAIDLWREGAWLSNPKLKVAAAWLMSAALFFAIGLRGWRWRRRPRNHFGERQ
jgi:hypothetical protein